MLHVGISQPSPLIRDNETEPVVRGHEWHHRPRRFSLAEGSDSPFDFDQEGPKADMVPPRAVQSEALMTMMDSPHHIVRVQMISRV
jgi:hypothetical protein